MRLMLALATLCSLAFGAAGAQTPSTTVVELRVADSLGRAIEGAEVLVYRGLTKVLQRRTSDSTGRVILPLEREGQGGPGYNLVARKIGFARGDRFIVADRDRFALELRLKQSAQSLAAVNVTTGPPIPANYFIDADAIAASPRPLESGIDIVEKMRPQMIWGNSGPPRRGTPICEKLSNVFVNGQLVRGAPPEAIQRASERLPNPGAAYNGVPKNMKMGEAAAATNAYVAEQIAKHSTYRVTGMPGAILTAIKPEHIAEIRYNDCFQGSVRVHGGSTALFIVLKPGIAYSQARGSYVAFTPAELATPP